MIPTQPANCGDDMPDVPGGLLARYVFQLDSGDPSGENPSLPVDGTATDVRVITYEGPQVLPASAFVGREVGFDHAGSDDGEFTIYRVSAQPEDPDADPVPWTKLDVEAGELIWFHATGQLAMAFNNDGVPFNELVPGTPARQINALNVATDRVFVTGQTEPAGYTPVVLPGDHDDPARNIEQHRRGIDAALASLVALVADLTARVEALEA